MTRWGATLRAGVSIALALVALGGLAPQRVAAQHRIVASSLAPLGDEGTPPPPTGGSTIARTSGDDQPDAEPGKNQTHVVYFVPKDKPDEELDTNGVLARSIDSIRAWFARETSKDEKPAKRPRIDRLTTGGWDMTFIRGDENAAFYDSLPKIADELKRKRMNAPNKRYLVYAAIGRGSTCGEGYFPLPAPGLDEGRYAAVYLDSNTGCGARDLGTGTAGTAGKAETIAVQEWLHNEGVTSPSSPHHCPTQPFHVCTGPLVYVSGMDPERVDASFPFVTLPLRDKVLDRDRDDYLDHPWPHLPNLRDSVWLE